MEDRWSIEQVIALAPSPARFAAADALSVPVRWSGLGSHERTAWGRCRGGGREPYDTMVDHVDVRWHCSCPSRVQPCKHALALLAMWARGQVPRADAPAGVVAWAARGAGSSAPGADGGTRSPVGGVGPGEAAGTAGADDADIDGEATPPPEAGRDERIGRMTGALAELDRWLDDRVRTGLADPTLARYATWDGLAARLVDGRAGALANRVRRLAGVVGARPDWHEVVLAELGILHLLAQGAARLPELPWPLADGVATACGWQVRQADVLAGVPDTDTWIVAGRSDTREDRIEVRRTWLRGLSTRRWAMVLSFAAYHQALDASLPVGARLVADLHRYPGASWRALVGRVHEPLVHAATVAPPAGSIAAACAEIGSRFAVEPWADRVPVTVRATPTVGDGRWVLTDTTGSLALAPDLMGLPTLLAASAGAPVDITAEWTADGVVPLTVHLSDRALDIGPRADPSFVSAA